MTAYSAVTQSTPGRLTEVAPVGKATDDRSAEDLRSTQTRKDTDPTPPIVARGDWLSLDKPVTIEEYTVRGHRRRLFHLHGKLVTQLKKVIMAWNNSQIRMAGGHVATQLGACTTRLQIRGRCYS